MTLNPRARNLVATTPSATQRARKPALIKPQTGNIALDRWVGAVTERLELAEGNRSRPLEETLTRRDLEKRLKEVGVIVQGSGVGVPAAGGVPVVTPTGTTYMDFDKFAASIYATKLFRDLTASINDPHRFDDLPAKTRDLLLQDIASLEAKVGARIRRSDEIFQNATESFAQTVQEVTANVQGAAAGVRQVMFAYASANRAVAGVVTQVQARLDNFSGGAPGTATVEQKMTAIADRATGLEAQYTLKVATNGAIAGFGLAATTSAAGVSTSAMLFLANKFAFITSSDVLGTGGGQINPVNPPANRIMFGIDSDGAYVGGNLKVTGKAFIDGVASTTEGVAALAVNHSLVQAFGIIAYSSNASSAAVLGTNSGGGSGLTGISSGGGNGVFGNAFGAGSHAGYFAGALGAYALKAVGGIDIDAAQFSALTTSVATFAGTKPGSATTNQWRAEYKDGVKGWVPWWPDA